MVRCQGLSAVRWQCEGRTAGSAAAGGRFASGKRRGPENGRGRDLAHGCSRIGRALWRRPWRNDPSTTADRRAQISLAATYIGVGYSSALRRTAHARGEAQAMPDAAIAYPPGYTHKGMVRATADSLSIRVEWPGPALSDAAFTNAMLHAQNNADQAAENSETILFDCTQPGTPAPPVLVPPPGPLGPMLDSFRGL